MSEARVVAVFVGEGRELPGDPPMRTGYRKGRRSDRVRVLREGLVGDEQVSRSVHGGPDRAVLAFAAIEYARWRTEDPARSYAYGTLAENVVVDDVDETDVCVGDRVRVGTALLEVTMPRWPCGTISRATGVEGLFEAVRARGPAGWLLRVLDEGELGEGDRWERVARPFPMCTIARAVDVMTRVRAKERGAVDEARAMATLPPLAAQWRDKLIDRAALVAPPLVEPQ